MSTCFASTFADICPPAKQTYIELNQKAPFVISFGCSMSQTHHTANTIHPDWLSQKIQNLAMESNNSLEFLIHKNHIGYVMRALPDSICSTCHTIIQPTKLHLINDKEFIKKLLIDASHQKNESKLTLTQCPLCSGKLIEQNRKEITLTQSHQQAMIDQINYLGVKNQIACTNFNLPTYRFSIEAADVLKQNSTEIDPLKMAHQANFIAQMGNPLMFLHHYAHPQTISDLFEKSEHAAWFANYCTEIIKACPNVTHICPISQPVALSHRVTRSTLPPFKTNISQAAYLNNINQAQVLACQEMKKINPNLKVLMSHQWKPFKPYHSMLSPWYALEKLACMFADKMYNGDFVRIFAPHQDIFDGIALSVYSALSVDKWIPVGNNCDGIFNKEDALEAIMQTHYAFPKKDIYIIEAGCNTKDPENKKAFIDMMLHVCKIAQNRGVNIKGLYFWGHTNDPEFYYEWNFQPESTHFAPFDLLDPQNPEGSVNAGGVYLKEILKP